MAIRFLHAADLHLDSPFDGLSPELAARRRKEQREILPRLVRLVQKHRCQAMLLPGDLFDGERVYPETVEAVETMLRTCGVPVFIAPGNHDFYRPGGIYDRLQLSENVHLFRENRITCVEEPALNLRVWGAAFTDSVCPPMLATFSPPEKRPGVTDVLCIHGTVGREGIYNPMTEAQLAGCGMDYVAMGHSHECSGLKKAGAVTYLWPGVPMARGYDETGVKGVVLVDVAPGAEAEAQFAALGGRQYYNLTVDVTGKDPLSAVQQAAETVTAQDFLRVTLTGTGEELPCVAALQRWVDGRCFRGEVISRVTQSRSVWNRKEEPTLRGLFLRKLWAQWQQAAPEERERIEQAARWGLAALDGGEEVQSQW